MLETPSPSGYESRLQQLVRDYVAGFADEVRTDLHGNVIVVKNPDSPLRVMLAGHCDQIGLIVQHIDDEGFLYIQPIGGWDPEVLIGQRMTVWTDAGPVFGVIARKPIHLLTEEERKQVPKMKDLWLDIGAANKEEAAKIGPHRRRGHRGAGLPHAAEQSGRLAGDGRQGRLLGRDRGPAPGVPEPARSSPAACTPSRPFRRNSGCAGPGPAPSASIRRSAWRST